MTRDAIALEPSAAAQPRRLIGVLPAGGLDALERTLGALEEIYPVRFEGREPGDLGGLDGVVILDQSLLPGVPAGLPALFARASRPLSGAGELVQFTDSALLARPLRARALREDSGHTPAPPPRSDSDSVLATVDGRAVWWSSERAELTVSAFALAELGERETLRSHLREGRFMGVLVLLHFLGGVCAELNWAEQPLRASFVIDDPNLHRTSYGFLRYAELIEHASSHGHHVGLAMVPLDGHLVNRRAAALVRANGSHVSLLAHGNDHVSRELGRLHTSDAAERAIGQALRRLSAFEARSGVRVRRVMIPPHGACSLEALRAMLRLGFQGACISRPYPWREEPVAALDGWYPAELVAGGLPILPRYHLDHPRSDLIFRALLRQPLILYGHHWDFAEGLQSLSEAVRDVNQLGEVQWGPLDWIAAHNYSLRRTGELLDVRMHSLSATVEIPAGVSAVRVHTQPIYGGPSWLGATCAGQQAPMSSDTGGWSSEPLAVTDRQQVEISLPPARPLQAGALSGPVLKPWPLARRVLVEGRDRLQPLLGARP
jgi:hypothetical protein